MSEHEFEPPHDSSAGTGDFARRRFLGALSALGAGALLPGCAGTGETAPGKPFRIDVHHHIAPPAYIAEARSRKLTVGDPKWTPARSIDDMDKAGVAYSITSLIQPAAAVGDVEFGRKISRLSNDYAAQLARDHKGRFGTFATIPFTDADGAMVEIAYALDTLKAEGFCLMTSYGGKYLGDRAFWPVLEELNRRKAVVYTHPLAPDCCRNVVPGVAVGTIEYATDTTRTMASLMFSGAAARYPDIKWIFSHSGGTAPFLISRFDRLEVTTKDKAAVLPHGFKHELVKFYYDTAQGHHPGALEALTKMVPVSQIMYGSDFPFRPGMETVEGLRGYRFSAAELRAIDRENALRIMPGIKI
jgi:predicted TIM-barrel fold metal-dependent hydrolase